MPIAAVAQTPPVKLGIVTFLTGPAAGPFGIPGRNSAEIMLEVSALHVSIGAIEIIRDAKLSLGERQFSGLIGRNGAGKTTLMRALVGALPARGIMTLDGLNLLAEPAHRRAALGLGYMTR